MNDLEKQVQKLGLSNIKYHIFICADQTKAKCCDKDFSIEIWEYLKERLSFLKLDTTIHRTKANCLRVCKSGPIMVIYPSGVWYHSIDKAVIDKIIEQHLLNNSIVKENLLAINQTKI